MHGAPELVITDRGAALTAALLYTVLRLSGTTHGKTMDYHPQTNRLTERLNKTLADMMGMYIHADHKNWDKILPYVTFEYNTARQEAARLTPFKLVYGWEATTMLDAMLPHECGDDENGAEEFTQHAEEARQLARLRIHEQEDLDARHYNFRHSPVTYNGSDHMWFSTPIRRRGLSEKLLRRYFGPYRLLRHMSDVNIGARKVQQAKVFTLA
ncbi:uncharacterized protein [Dermacentor albipictus]|uniref:uncharacterized protein n=1 Tax=Dermacentor albipictus TaxID=60249 RepID=UPI0038FC6720